MSDAQLAAILTAVAAFGGAIAAAIRWGVMRLVKAQDRATDAIIANTASNATLITKLEHVADRIDRISDFVDEMTPVEIPKPSRGYRPPARPPSQDMPPRAKTIPRLVVAKRDGDGEDE